MLSLLLVHRLPELISCFNGKKGIVSYLHSSMHHNCQQSTGVCIMLDCPVMCT